MTLSEIETILQQLAHRHENLDKELLTTLLTASGWEEKVVKDALMLFSQQKKSTVVQKVISQAVESVAPSKEESAPITFYQQDGSEEGKLHEFVVPESVKKESVVEARKVSVVAPEEKEENTSRENVEKMPIVADVIETPSPPQEKNLQAEEKKELRGMFTSPVIQKSAEAISLPFVPLQNKELEPGSLIEAKELPKEKRVESVANIPENLPLLPFESSPHVWSFSKYKEFFHKEDVKEVVTVMPHDTIMQVMTVMPEEGMKSFEKSQSVESLSKRKVLDEGVVLESVPLDRKDGPLVFLAGVMLLVIILILGYMYSNGRL